MKTYLGSSVAYFFICQTIKYIVYIGSLYLECREHFPKLDSMDHCVFQFATRWQCIKRQQCYHISIYNKIRGYVQNNLSFFPFMHCPLVANWKTRWSIEEIFWIDNCAKNVFVYQDFAFVRIHWLLVYSHSSLEPNDVADLFCWLINSTSLTFDLCHFSFWQNVK